MNNLFKIILSINTIKIKFINVSMKINKTAK